MKIIIVGCGKVGYSLAEQLTKENHDVFVIDKNNELLEDVAGKLDIMVAKGRAESISSLQSAGVKEADLLIAVTMSDELNMICCLLAKKSGCKYTVARVRNTEYNKERYILQKELGIDLIINPENTAAYEIAKLLSVPSAKGIETFAEGRVDMVGIRLNQNDGIIDKPLASLGDKLPKRVLVCAIERQGEIFIPNGSFIMRGGDVVYVMSDHKSIGNFYKVLNRNTSKVKNIMIAGGGRISIYLAWILRESSTRIKIIEKSEETCRLLKEMVMDKVIVINNDASEQSALDDEDLKRMDAFIAVTDRDEENLLSALYAKNCNVPHVIAKMNRPNYKKIINDLGIDSVIVPKDLTANVILRYARSRSNIGGGTMEALYKIADGRAEAAEFTATKETKFLNIPLSKVNIKAGILIGAIVRKDEVIIPHGDDYIMEKDKVVVFVCDRVVNHLNDLLEV